MSNNIENPLSTTKAPEYLITNNIQIQSSVLKTLVKFSKDSPLTIFSGKLYGIDNEDILNVQSALYDLDNKTEDSSSYAVNKFLY